MVLAIPRSNAIRQQTKRESARHTRFSDHGLTVKNSVKGKTIFILIAIGLEKGT